MLTFFDDQKLFSDAKELIGQAAYQLSYQASDLRQIVQGFPLEATIFDFIGSSATLDGAFQELAAVFCPDCQVKIKHAARAEKLSQMIAVQGSQVYLTKTIACDVTEGSLKINDLIQINDAVAVIYNAKLYRRTQFKLLPTKLSTLHLVTHVFENAQLQQFYDLWRGQQISEELSLWLKNADSGELLQIVSSLSGYYCDECQRSWPHGVIESRLTDEHDGTSYSYEEICSSSFLDLQRLLVRSAQDDARWCHNLSRHLNLLILSDLGQFSATTKLSSLTGRQLFCLWLVVIGMQKMPEIYLVFYNLHILFSYNSLEKVEVILSQLELSGKKVLLLESQVAVEQQAVQASLSSNEFMELLATRLALSESFVWQLAGVDLLKKPSLLESATFLSKLREIVVDRTLPSSGNLLAALGVFNEFYTILCSSLLVSHPLLTKSQLAFLKKYTLTAQPAKMELNFSWYGFDYWRLLNLTFNDLLNSAAFFKYPNFQWYLEILQVLGLQNEKVFQDVTSLNIEQHFAFALARGLFSARLSHKVGPVKLVVFDGVLVDCNIRELQVFAGLIANLKSSGFSVLLLENSAGLDNLNLEIFYYEK